MDTIVKEIRREIEKGNTLEISYRIYWLDLLYIGRLLSQIDYPVHVYSRGHNGFVWITSRENLEVIFFTYSIKLEKIKGINQVWIS